MQRLQADVRVRRRLEWIDDDVRDIRATARADWFTNGEGRAAVCEADLDHDVSIVISECVTQDVAVHARQRDALEVALEGPAALRTGRMEIRTDDADAIHLVIGGAHEGSRVGSVPSGG